MRTSLQLGEAHLRRPGEFYWQGGSKGDWGSAYKYSLARGKHGVWNWLHGFVNKPTMLGKKLKSWNSDLRKITNPQGGLLNLIQFGRSGTSTSARYFPSLLCGLIDRLKQGVIKRHCSLKHIVWVPQGELHRGCRIFLIPFFPSSPTEIG